MKTANPVRGEVGLRLASGDHLLRPTFSALVAAEAEVGSLLGVLDRAGSGDLRLADMCALFWHSRVATGETSDRAVFEAELLGVGLAALVAPYRQLLTAIFGLRQ